MTSYEILRAIESIVRWVHVFAAILWIGQMYLFQFISRRLKSEEGGRAESAVWLVHGGGFYQVTSHEVSVVTPADLRWFKWESAATWLSGVVLIAIRYYASGLLVEPGMSYAFGVAAGIGSVVVAWLVYDGLMRSPLGKNELALAVVGLLLIVGLHFGLTTGLSSRAAFMHVGAALGTIMAANVWAKIPPSHRRMITLARERKQLDSDLAQLGPQRSKHNSYIALPLLFIMIANHYPSFSYGSDYSSVVLGVVFAIGWIAARALLRR